MSWRKVFAWDIVPEDKRVRLLHQEGWLFHGYQASFIEIEAGHMGTVVGEDTLNYLVDWDGMPAVRDIFPNFPDGWATPKAKVEVVE